MTASLMVAFARIFAGAMARWVNCEPSARQRIYFANHTSNLDFVVLWASLPKPIRARTRPAAAHDYWTASPLRFYFASKVFNAVLIERRKVTAHNNPIDLMLSAIGNEYSLIIFPEGGRNPGPEPGPFKSGLYHLGIKRPDIELVPVFIDNANRILPKGEVLPVPLISCIRFGAPLRVEENEKKEAFLARAREAVINLAGC
jgi:1-acyl-sn-glycerol-3-phosphate acyltransferase